VQVKSLLTSKGRDAATLVDWSGYKAIDAVERSLGQAKGKPREKLVTLDDLLKAAKTKTTS
jgi:hypothetical protein